MRQLAGRIGMYEPRARLSTFTADALAALGRADEAVTLRARYGIEGEG
jgi:hypothetical protein